MILNLDKREKRQFLVANTMEQLTLYHGQRLRSSRPRSRLSHYNFYAEPLRGKYSVTVLIWVKRNALVDMRVSIEGVV